MHIFKLLLTLSLCANLAFAARTAPRSSGSGGGGGVGAAMAGGIVSSSGVAMNANHLQTFNNSQQFMERMQNLCGALQQVQPQPQLDAQAAIPQPLCGNGVVQNQAVEAVTEVVPASRCSRPNVFDRETETLNYCGCLRVSFLSPLAQRNDLTGEVRQTYKRLIAPGPQQKEIKVDIISGMLEVYKSTILKKYSNYRALYGANSFSIPNSCKPAQMINALTQASSGFASGELVSASCNSESCAEAPEIASKAIRDTFRLGQDEELDQGVLSRTDSRLVNFTNGFGQSESSCVRSASTENLLVLMPQPADVGAMSDLRTTLDASMDKLRAAKDSFGSCQSGNISNFRKVVEDFTSGSDRDLVKSLEIVNRLNGSIEAQFWRARKEIKTEASPDQLKAACEQIKSIVSASVEFYEEAEEVNQSSSSASSKLSKLDKAYKNLIEDTRLSNDQLAQSSEFLQGQMERECNNFLSDVSLLACSDSNVLQSDTLRLMRNFGSRMRTISHSPIAVLGVFGGPPSAVNISAAVSSSMDCSRTSSVDCKAQDLVQCDAISPAAGNGRRRTSIASSLSFLESPIVRRSLNSVSSFSAENFDVKRRSAVSYYCAGFGAHLRTLPECRNVPEAEKESCLRENFYAVSDDPALNDQAAQRLQQAISGYSNRSGITSDIKDLLVAVATSAKPHGSLGEELVMQELSLDNKVTREAGDDLRNGRVSRSDLDQFASVLGSVGGGSLSSSSGSSTAASLFNTATVQAFGAQARVSAATSTAVMNRFIAAVPPMQNMSSSEQRQQVDQALERSVNQTVAELENKASGSTSPSERQKYLDEIAELRRLMADQTARNDLISQQMAAMNQASQNEDSPAPASKRKRAPASVASSAPEVEAPVSSGFQSGGGRSGGSQATSGSVGGSQDLAGAQGFGGSSAAAGRSVSSVSEARDAAPTDNSLRLVVGGAGGQVIPAAQVVTISVSGGDEQALKEAILGQRERLNVGEDGFAVVEVIDPASGRATLVRVKIENDDVIVQNFTAEQLRNTTIVSESNPQPRQIRYSLQAMTNLLNQASGGSN